MIETRPSGIRVRRNLFAKQWHSVEDPEHAGASGEVFYSATEELYIARVGVRAATEAEALEKAEALLIGLRDAGHVLVEGPG